MSAYWDNVAEKVSLDGTIRDNWVKRRGLVKHLLNYDLTNTHILEIGSGLGLTAAMLNMIYGGHFKYTGTDISEKFCKLASEKAHLTVLNVRPDNLPFEDKKFDCLFAFDVLEHIPANDKPNVYKELNRVLTDTAYVYINNPHPNNPCGHSPEEEHGFGEADIAEMCRVLKMEVYEFTTYYGSPGYKYNFIVLKRA